jgi:hypothetical protein
VEIGFAARIRMRVDLISEIEQSITTRMEDYFDDADSR